MPDAIKNRYNYESLRNVALDIQSVYDPFEDDEFLKSTVDDTWEALELKDRMYRISTILGNYLPTEYGAAIGIIDNRHSILCYQ